MLRSLFVGAGLLMAFASPCLARSYGQVVDITGRPTGERIDRVRDGQRGVTFTLRQTPGQPSTVQCPYCRDRFGTVDAWRKHYLRFH